MLNNLKNLKRLPVKTEGGVFLGKIQDLEIDVINHTVYKYIVAAPTFFKNAKFAIAPAQIVKITAKEIIVIDARDKSLSPLTEGASSI